VASVSREAAPEAILNTCLAISLGEFLASSANNYNGYERP